MNEDKSKKRGDYQFFDGKMVFFSDGEFKFLFR